MTLMGVSGVLSRIQEIQNQLNPNAINPDGTVTTTGSSGDTDPTFASLLDPSAVTVPGTTVAPSGLIALGLNWL